VLASPSLTALSGQSASFLAGGELPIPVAGGLGTTTIMYKPFGIGLTVTPTVLAANRIALKVAPEASEIDYRMPSSAKACRFLRSLPGARHHAGTRGMAKAS